ELSALPQIDHAGSTRQARLRARDLPFRPVWKELKINGWTCKMAPSRSLDDRYRYIRPGAYPIGTEGLDLVLGPDDALEFYTQAYVMSESTYRMPLLYVLFFTSRMKRELLHPPHPSSDRTTGVLIWSLPPHVLMRHVRLRVEHVVSSREARDHAHYSHDDCSLLHRRTPPMVRTTTQLTTRVVDDLGADDDDSVDWTGYSAEEDEVLEG
ncbi:hypothetical protein JG687_00015596, partial [Phytophthora cactorum]